MSDRPTYSTPPGDGLRSGKSAGQLIKEVTEDFSTLIRKEIELAKQEIGAAVGTKAKGAAIILIGAAFGFFALIFLLLAVLSAKSKLTAPIKADLTKKTIKDDVEFAKSLGRNKSSTGQPGGRP